MIPFNWTPPPDRYGTSDNETHPFNDYRGKRLTAADQEAILAMWQETYDPRAICYRFGIPLSTLLMLTTPRPRKSGAGAAPEGLGRILERPVRLGR
jgi:hypothetical protein